MLENNIRQNSDHGAPGPGGAGAGAAGPGGAGAHAAGPGAAGPGGAGRCRSRWCQCVAGPGAASQVLEARPVCQLKYLLGSQSMYLKEWTRVDGRRLLSDDLEQIFQECLDHLAPEPTGLTIPDEDQLQEVARLAEIKLGERAYLFTEIYPLETASKSLLYRCAEWTMRLTFKQNMTEAAKGRN